MEVNIKNPNAVVNRSYFISLLIKTRADIYKRRIAKMVKTPSIIRSSFNPKYLSAFTNCLSNNKYVNVLVKVRMLNIIRSVSKILISDLLLIYTNRRKINYCTC